MSRILILISTFWLLLSPVSSQERRPDAEVKQFLARFIRAFDDLDWETFRHSFSDDATSSIRAESPNEQLAEPSSRKTSKLSSSRFESAGKHHPTWIFSPGTWQHNYSATLRSQLFHLDDRVGFVNRRTIALRRTGAGWKIVHLHASEVATEH